MERLLSPGWILLAGLAIAVSLGASCGGSGSLGPRPGWRATDAAARVPLPVGELNAMGGNWSLVRRDLSIDTWLGDHDIGAVWNSAERAWQWSFDLHFDGYFFNGPTGARYAASVADGEPLEGTVWTRLDAQRMRTRGGKVHVFSAASGKLEAVHWASAAWPRIRYVTAPVAGSQHVVAVEQCSDPTTCLPVFTIERGASGEVTRIVDRAGRQAEFDYDAQGHLIAARDGKDVAEGWPGHRYEYLNGHITAVTNSEGERVELEYGGRRLERLRQIGAGDPEWTIDYLSKSAEGPSTLYTTDVSSPLGATTRHRFDGTFRLHERENALGEIETWEWTGLRPTRHVGMGGEVTQWVWSQDEIAIETLPSGNVVHRVYAVGATNRLDSDRTPVASVTDSIGPVGSAQYDSAGRLISATDGNGEITTFSWNSQELLASVVLPSGSTTSYANHGEHGHPTTVVLDGFSTSDVYDAVGNLVHSDRPDAQSGGVLERRWDEDRRIASLLLQDLPVSAVPTQAVLTVTRRSDGRIVQIGRPLGGDVFVFYDALGREVVRAELVSDGSASSPVARYSTRSWDAESRPIASERPNGMRQERSYDAAGRVSRERTLRGTVVESDVSYTWSGGRPVLAEDPDRGFAESRTYDSAGRVASIVHPGGERTLSQYDARSRLVARRLETASGTLLQRVTFGWDSRNELERIGDGTADLVQWQRVGGAITNESHASGLDEVRSIVLGLPATQAFETNGTGQGLLITGRTPSGSVSLQHSQGQQPHIAGVQQVTWDLPWVGAERRLEGAVDPYGHEWRYFFDHASNLTRSTETGAPDLVYHYNAEHTRLLSVSSGGSQVASWTWDVAGFATSRGGNAIEWTARGALRRILDTQGAELAGFDYDALGRPVARRVGAEVIGWSHGGLVELDALGSPVAVDLGPVRVRLVGQHLYRHTDQRGNVAFESDENGQMLSRHVYGAFGRSHTVGDPGARRHTFARGTEFDVDSVLGPLQVMGARVYDPYAARFLSPDPMPQLVNDHAYTLGNPIEFWDPTGLVFGEVTWEQLKPWLVAASSTLEAIEACKSANTLGCAAAVVRAGIDIRDAFGSLPPVVIPDVPAPPIPLPELPISFDPGPLFEGTVTLHDVTTSGSGGGSGWDHSPGLDY